MARYPKAIWHPANPKNIGGKIGKIRLGVMHVEQGTQAGTNAWFQNPKAQVSAHFGVAKTGEVYQFVDTNTIAWAEQDYNDVAISIEHEGLTGEKLTQEQINADVALYVWLHLTCGIPLVRTTNPNGTGWIGHGELGIPGGDHLDCPGNPILAQIPLILKEANAKVNPPKPEPTPKPIPPKVAPHRVSDTRPSFLKRLFGK